VIQIFLLNFTAILGLIEIGKAEQSRIKAAFKNSLIAIGSIFVILFVFYYTTNFKGDGQIDKYIMNAISTAKDTKSQTESSSIYNALLSDRQTILFDSLLRSLFIGLTALGLLWLYLYKKVQFFNYKLLLVSFAIIGLIDLSLVNETYLSSNSFVDKEETNNSYLQAQPVDLEIQKDKSDYRVLDLRSGDIGSVFNGGAITAYFHKTIGGYHPAKLSLTQDLIENQLYNFPNCMPTVNMLNTKYIIDQQGQIYPNTEALGAAWFVKGIQWAKDPAAEMSALTNLNAKDTVVMNIANQKSISGLTQFDTTANIKLVTKSNDVLEYQAVTKNSQLAVFSEIYYDKGWKAYIDNKEAPILKSNYLLRSLIIPAGTHTVKFEFKPAAYYDNILFAKISEWISILLILILVGTWLKNLKANQKKELR
jgi:hypothetical protein